MNQNLSYIPVLRWKSAERDALKDLSQDAKDSIIPLIVVQPSTLHPNIPTSSTDVSAIFSRIANQIHDVWEDRPIFVDLELIEKTPFIQLGTHPVTAMWDMSVTFFPSLFPKLIPVTSLDRDNDFQNAVLKVLSTFKTGLCLRIRKEDINFNKSKEKIGHFLETMNLNPHDVDLVIDYKHINSLQDYQLTCKNVPFLNNWRTFTIIAGSFPEDLQDLDPHNNYYLERWEWRSWYNLINNPSLLCRLPLYGDYTIQHPSFKDFDGISRTSASIRYTITDNFLVIRGEWLLKPGGLGYAQYPAQAALLCSLPEYSGKSFSAADKHINDISVEFSNTGGAKNPGNPTTWLCVGFNHHISFSIYQSLKIINTKGFSIYHYQPELFQGYSY